MFNIPHSSRTFPPNAYVTWISRKLHHVALFDGLKPLLHFRVQLPNLSAFPSPTTQSVYNSEVCRIINIIISRLTSTVISKQAYIYFRFSSTLDIRSTKGQEHPIGTSWCPTTARCYCTYDIGKHQCILTGFATNTMSMQFTFQKLVRMFVKSFSNSEENVNLLASQSD